MFIGMVVDTDENAPNPNDGATDDILVISVRPLQFSKALSPMLVAELPMVTEVRPLQL